MPETAFLPAATIRSEIGRAARRVKRTGDPTAAAKLDQLRSEHTAAKIAEYVAKTVATAPPLTDDQRSRLAALLRPAGGGIDA